MQPGGLRLPVTITPGTLPSSSLLCVQKIHSMSLPDLYNIMNQHRERLKFLMENDILSDTWKIQIVESVKEIYDVTHKRNSNDTIRDNTDTSRSVS